MDQASADDAVDAVALALRGQPLHTRALEVEAFREGAGTVRCESQVLDLRKCDFVPTGGDLQTAGVIHQMKLGLWLDASRRIQRLETEQPHIAYEADPVATGGECCRDPAPRLQGLVGKTVDTAFAKTLGGLFGGALGCSHLLTLGQLSGSTLRGGLDRENAGGHAALRADGERLFKRTLTLDGASDGPGRMEVAIQLADFDLHPRSDVRHPFDRLARQHDVRVHARVDLAGMSLVDVDAAERTRSGATLGSDTWISKRDVLAPLVGAPALGGLSARLFAVLGGAAEHSALLDTLLNLAPGLIQCLAATSGRWISAAARGDDRRREASTGSVAMGGFPDSCYMWREGSPLSKNRDLRTR